MSFRQHHHAFLFLFLLQLGFLRPAIADNIHHGDIVHAAIAVLSAATGAPIPGAAVRISTKKNETFLGSEGFAGPDGIFHSLFDNTNDFYGTRLQEVYVQPSYTYHYGYNPLTGSYEWFYGEDPSTGGYQWQEVPVSSFTAAYNVAAAAVGYEYKMEVLPAQLGKTPHTVNGSIRLPLVSPPDYANAFLQRLYPAVLHRGLDGYGAQVWADQLRSQTRGEVALDILRSPERSSNLINDYFDHFLHRAPNLGNAAELKAVKGYLTLLTQKGTEEDVLKQLLSTPAYYNAKGGNRNAFLFGLYEDVLGRAPTPTEMHKAPSNRADAVGALVKTRDYKVMSIQSWYQNYLAHPADDFAIGFWLQAFSSQSTFEIQADILGSDEFLHRP